MAADRYMAWCKLDIYIIGGIYCIVLLAEKLTGFAERLGIFSHLYTMLVVILAWVLFRAESIASAGVYIGEMFGIGASGLYDVAAASYLNDTKTLLIIALIAATPLYKKICDRLKDKGFGWIEQVWLVAVFIISVVQVVGSTYSPFIYFNF